MDYSSEVVNITKIKDGFFLGDEPTAANLDVVIQFKITHMINAAGSQIINSWETIGIKYLTLNWSENPNQNLFDQKDEIANRIVNFVDEAIKSGEGILAHSLRGNNRGCVVILIYFIKKYRWSLAKALEFLSNKKPDVEVPKYFLNQLSMFESRLSKVGVGPRSNNWNELPPLNNECDENVIRNTYLNGLTLKTIQGQNIALMQNFDRNSLALNKNKKICWSDNNLQRKDLLCSTNLNKELIYQKEIKPILSHKKMKPAKPILKVKSSSGVMHSNTEQKKTNSSTSVYNINSSNLNNSIIANNKNNNNIYPVSIRDSTNLLTNFNSNVNSLFESKAEIPTNSSYSINSHGVNYANNLTNDQSRISSLNKENDLRINRIASPDFNTPNTNTSQHRSFSVDQKNDRGSANQRNNGEVTKIIITTPNVQSIINNNINNIYIQNPNNLDLEKLTGRYSDFENKVNSNKKEFNNLDVDRITSSIRSPSMNNNSDQNVRQSLIPSSTQNKMSKSIDPRLMQNNYLLSNTNVLESKNLKVVDYNSNTTNQSGYLNQSTKLNNFNNYTPTYNIQSKTPMNLSQTLTKQNFSVNNYQPELNKKNNSSSSLLTRPNSQITNKQGPVKIHNDYERKPSTPDTAINNISTMKLINNSNSNSKLNNNSNFGNSTYGYSNPQQQYGTLKRTNSSSKKQANERPSTAPQKDKQPDERILNQQSSLKRLPSPNLKSSSMNNSVKNLGQNINISKYRSPSPSSAKPSSTITMGSLRMAGNKPKWK